MGRIEVWARPGSRRDLIGWDDWRKCWVVSCRETPTGGRANEAILRLIAEGLDVPRSSLRYIAGGRTRAKLVEVDGVMDSEIATRLRQARLQP